MATNNYVGWEEWVGLPQLGLPALEAKVDTGARTSALHAFDIELFGPANKPKVRFLINPIPVRPDLAIACSATIHDRCDVTSSNGDTEARYVILSPLEIGPLRQEIEITLTDRANMSYRMLLGRQTIGADWIITPQEVSVSRNAVTRSITPLRSKRPRPNARCALPYLAAKTTTPPAVSSRSAKPVATQSK